MVYDYAIRETNSMDTSNLNWQIQVDEANFGRKESNRPKQKYKKISRGRERFSLPSSPDAVVVYRFSSGMDENNRQLDRKLV